MPPLTRAGRTIGTRDNETSSRRFPQSTSQVSAWQFPTTDGYSFNFLTRGHSCQKTTDGMFHETLTRSSGLLPPLSVRAARRRGRPTGDTDRDEPFHHYTRIQVCQRAEQGEHGDLVGTSFNGICPLKLSLDEFGKWQSQNNFPVGETTTSTTCRDRTLKSERKT